MGSENSLRPKAKAAAAAPVRTVKGDGIMRVDPLKVSSVLGDPTRYAIYQFIIKSGTGSVTATEIAQQFSLHPNVARMHLQKLEDLGLLKSVTADRGGRGRPGMAYLPSGQAVGFYFPARDYELLSHLLCDALATLGDQAYPVLSKVGQAYGRQVAEHVLTEMGDRTEPISFAEAVSATARALEEHGLDPVLLPRSSGGFDLTLRNCGFREAATRHPELVCHLCHAIVEGAITAHAENASLTGERSIPTGATHCNYVVIDEIDLPDGTTAKLEKL
jgi:predicted ArsR family transcriptional regulator